jgi:tRNA(Ile)-lysidine synthase TilS/MesJ
MWGLRVDFRTGSEAGDGPVRGGHAAPLAGLGSESAIVAVSGGVDSMTLATLARRLIGRARVVMAHAVSPAVPAEATERVRRLA